VAASPTANEVDVPTITHTDALIAQLYDSVLDDAVWPSTLAGIARLFDASTATVWRCNTRTLQITDFTAHGHDDRAMTLYATHYVTLDPATPKVLAAGTGQWLADEVLMDARVREHQPYLHEFALPNGIGRVGGGKVSTESDTCLYLGLQRQPGTRPFGTKALRNFQAIAPHLARAHKLHEHIKHVNHGFGLAESVLDQLSAPLCVLNLKGRVLMANRAASMVFATDAPLTVRDGHLRAAMPNLHDQLQAALTRACAPSPQGSDWRTVSQTGIAWRLSMVPLPQGHGLHHVSEGAAGTPRALLVIGRVERPDVTRLRLHFGLTRAEADLLAALASGESATAYANRRGVTVATVRTHSAALLAKMNCSSQLSLVALARSLPGLLTSDATPFPS